MANAGTGADSLGLYLTGVLGDVNAYSPDYSLGGRRLGVEVQPYAWLIGERVIPPLIVEQVTGANGEGVGLLAATGTDSVTWTPPGGSAGDAVTIADGETKLIEGATASKAIRITRDSSDDLGGQMDVELLTAYANLLAFDAVTNTERGAGHNSYRAGMLRNRGSLAQDTLRVYVKTLATQRTSDAGQLGASGSGTIETTGSFADWPASGWAHVRTSGGSTREIVYYASRTSTVLNVASGHRGRLGTSAAAGASDDTVDAVPGIRIGWESPSAGKIQSVANDTTAPSGITWSTGISAADGLQLASLAAGAEQGLWLHREIPALAAGSASLENAIVVAWTVDGTDSYEQNYQGYYRMAEDHLENYEVYIGEDADPDLSASPDVTAGSLPFPVSITPPASGTTQFRITVLQRNKYGLAYMDPWWFAFDIDAAGDDVTPAISAPEDVILTNIAGGEVDVAATYSEDRDADPATRFAIYARTDGTDPDPATDTPTYVAMRPNYIGAGRRLAYTLGPYDYGTDLRVLVRANRSSDGEESTNTTATTTTVDTAPPSIPRRIESFLGTQNGFARGVYNETDYYFDAPNMIWMESTPGVVAFWAGSVLVWRCIYDSMDAANSRIWVPNTWALKNTAISGAGTSDVIETAAWNGTKTLYCNVDSVRRMRIDVTGLALEATSWHVTGDIPPMWPDSIVHQGTDYVLFCVYDGATGRWVPYLKVTDAGAVHALIGIDNYTYNQAQIEAL